VRKFSVMFFVGMVLVAWPFCQCSKSSNDGALPTCAELCMCKDATCVGECQSLLNSRQYTDAVITQLYQCISSVGCEDSDYLSLQSGCFINYMTSQPASPCESGVLDGICGLSCSGFATVEECRDYLSGYAQMSLRGYTTQYCSQVTGCLDTFNCASDPTTTCDGGWSIHSIFF